MKKDSIILIVNMIQNLFYKVIGKYIIYLNLQCIFFLETNNCI